MGVLAGAASLSPSILTLKSVLSENIDQISNNVQYYGCSDGPTLLIINIEVAYIFHDHNLFNSYCLACHHCSLYRGQINIWKKANQYLEKAPYLQARNINNDFDCIHYPDRGGV